MKQCKIYFEKAYYEFEICYVPAGTSGGESLFGVSDYLAALALLLVIYTISDYRIKLRLSLAPLPIYRLGFWLFVCALTTKAAMELWFNKAWPLLPALDNKLLLDAILLTPCVIAILYWVYVSYITPPKFSRWNSRKFFWTYQQIVHNGTDEELRIALHELTRSAKSIISCSSQPPVNQHTSWRPTSTEATAHDFLLLLGNRRLCSEIARGSPHTAKELFHEIATQGKFGLPYETFAQNVAIALLSDKSSPIFHEDSGWESGWSGYAQIYSSEIFSNPRHIIALAKRHSSPLDVRYSTSVQWDAENWKAYTRVALLYFERLAQESPHMLTDCSVFQILESCKSMATDAYRLNGAENTFHQIDEFRKLRVLSEFLKDLMKLLDRHKVPIWSSVKPTETFRNGFHEHLAELVFEVVFFAASVRYPARTCWEVTHNMVWAGLFRLNDSDTSRWVFRRVSRMIYDEIRLMDNFFNFKGAAYLGFSLNVLGLNDKRHRQFGKESNPLRLAALQWARKNYSRMKEQSPKVAEACLHGSISFDEGTLEIVKTYANETRKIATEARFKVNPA